MAEAILEKAVCEKCGADVRESMLFCYNCGNKYAAAIDQPNGAEPNPVSDETRSALDDLAARMKLDEPEGEDKIKLAAAERKKARVAPKRQTEDTWENVNGRSGGAFFVIALVIFFIVAAIVFITLYWK